MQERVGGSRESCRSGRERAGGKHGEDGDDAHCDNGGGNSNHKFPPLFLVGGGGGGGGYLTCQWYAH